MYSTGGLRGRIHQGETPNWKPLLDLAPRHVDEVMWMFEVESEDGARIQAYKHRWTRLYLHLDCEGRAFVYGGNGRYHRVVSSWLLDLVLPRHPRP